MNSIISIRIVKRILKKMVTIDTIILFLISFIPKATPHITVIHQRISTNTSLKLAKIPVKNNTNSANCRKSKLNTNKEGLV